MPTSASEIMAKQRTLKMKAWLSKELEQMKRVEAQMKNLLDRGFALDMSSEEEKQSSEVQVWYRPCLSVTHDQKPGKIRLCHDCRAEANGVSLNFMVSSGPDLNTNLV